MGDGMTMNILLQDLNRRYLGIPVVKEKFSFYEYIIDTYENEKSGGRKRDLAYYDELLRGTTLDRSILNKKEKEDSRVSFVSEGLSNGPGHLVWRGLL